MQQNFLCKNRSSQVLFSKQCLLLLQGGSLKDSYVCAIRVFVTLFSPATLTLNALRQYLLSHVLLHHRVCQKDRTENYIAWETSKRQI